MKMGEILVQMGIITKDLLQKAIEEQQKGNEATYPGETIGNFLLRNQIITEEQQTQALQEYFRQLSENTSEASYVRETAKVAYLALDNRNEKGTLSEETKLAIIRRVNELEEKISFLERSVESKKKFQQTPQINLKNEKAEIQKTIEKIGFLRNDLEKFS